MKARFGSCAFVNEIGREISIEVMQVDGKCVIRIIGPDSMAENELTRMEAEKLHASLTFLLAAA